MGDPLVRIPLHHPRTPWQTWAAGLVGVAALLGTMGYFAARHTAGRSNGPR